jgi:hypothetical protein
MNSVTQLVERNATRARLEQAAHRPHCPTHPATVLDGGPVQFHCDAGTGHRVMAADIDHEYRAGGAA